MVELHLKNVKKTYEGDSFTINIDELEINSGEFFGLLGPSGCGKTTLLKLIAGLIKPDSGTIEANSQSITMVFQQPLLFTHLNIEKNIEFGLKMNKVEKSKRKQLIDESLRVVGLQNYNKKYPSELSGGQMQRVSIARAIVLEPKILLMDEPFSALDPSLREDMRKLILDIHTETKMTIIFVTHDIDEAFELFSRVAVLKQGRIIDIGSPEYIYKTPSNIDSARFLKSNNIIRLPFEELIPEINYTENDMKNYNYAIIRPESFQLRNRYIQNRVSEDDREIVTALGTVEEIKEKMGIVYSSVRTGDRIIEVLEKFDNQQVFCIGDKVEIIYKRQDIHFIE